MFICQICHKLIEKREKPVMVVTKTRTKEYYKRDKDGNLLPVKPSARKKRYGNIATGVEIEQEIQCCKACATERQNAI